jgi:cyclophilin family peptidyl-prolyl cis-trans isomerase
MTRNDSRTARTPRRAGATACAALGAMLALAAPASRAWGQLTALRTYVGVDRAIPVRVERPAGAVGELEVQLLAPPSMEVLGTAPVREGDADLGALFGEIWRPVGEPRVLYVQLSVNDQRVGSALVLQPLLHPGVRARVDPVTRRPRFDPPARRTLTGVRVWADRHVLLDTSEGVVEFALRPDAAPNTAWHFLTLVERGFYTDVPFHRVVAAAPMTGHPFVVQTGDPTGTGRGGLGETIALEASSLPHDFGVLSMARTDDPDSGSTQVFICLSREGTAFLDGAYASFGYAVAGEDTILRLERTPVGAGDRPLEMPRVLRAVTIPAPPAGRGPAPAVRPTEEQPGREPSVFPEGDVSGDE